AEMPTQSPWGELYLAGERLSVEASTLASSPLSCRLSSGGEFSVRNKSAGEFVPSVAIWLASASSSSLRIATWIPVCFSNAATRFCAVCTCWPLYRVSVAEPLASLVPQAASAPQATRTAAAGPSQRACPKPLALPARPARGARCACPKPLARLMTPPRGRGG